jgi:hypothetical protein
VSFLINPYRYAAGGGLVTWTDLTSGALVHRSTNVSVSANGSAAWDAETYDTASWHDTSSNTDRLTVPSGVSLVRIVGNSASSTGGYWYLMKGGSGFDGQAYERSDTDGAENTNIASAIVAVSATNYFTMHSVSSLTMLASGSSSNSWFAAEAIASDKPYAHVKSTSNQTLAADTWTIATFATEIADTHGFYDNSASASRLTVPSGFNKVRLSANIRYDGGTSSVFIRLLKNGSVVPGSFRKSENGGSSRYINANSAVLEVTPGDYFQMEVYAVAAGDIISGNATWFQIEGIHPDTKYCLAYATQGTTRNSAYGLVPFNVVAVSNDSFRYSSTATITIASPGVVSWTAHGLIDGTPVVFTTTGALPTGLTAGTVYYVVSSAANSFSVATTYGGSAINTSGSQSGTHTVTAVGRLKVPAGHTQARLSFTLNATVSGQVVGRVLKNGDTSSFVPGLPYDEAQTSSDDGPGGLGAWVNVSENDYFEVESFGGANANFSTTGETWFCIECR